MLNRIKILLLILLSLSTINLNAQKRSSLTFFMPTDQSAYPSGRITYAGNFDVTTQPGYNFSLTALQSGLPYISATTLITNSLIGFAQGNYNTNLVSTLDLSTNQIKSVDVGFSPSVLESYLDGKEGAKIYAGNNQGNQLVKINSNLVIDKSFVNNISSNDVVVDIKFHDKVLYVLVMNNTVNISYLNSRVLAIDPSSGAIMETLKVGSSSMLSIANGIMTVASSYRDDYTPGANKSIVKIFQITKQNNTITFSQTGNDIILNYSLMDLHTGSDGFAYGLCYEQKLFKIKRSDASIEQISDIKAGLPQMTIPYKIFTANNEAFIFWIEDRSRGNTQVVVSDLSTPSINKISHNTGQNVHDILMIVK